MANRVSTEELKHRYQSLKEGLEIKDEEIMDMLTTTRMHDDMGIEIIIRDEGAKKAINNFILDLEDSYLEKLNIEDIYKYKDLDPITEWDFLEDKDKIIIQNTYNFYKKIKVNYALDRADLMIMRKEVYNFIIYKLRTVSKTFDEKEMINYIINNYTYADTIKSLGFLLFMDENGDSELKRYKLDEKTLKYIL